MLYLLGIKLGTLKINLGTIFQKFYKIKQH